MTSSADKIAGARIPRGVCEAPGWGRQRVGSQGRPRRRPYPKLLTADRRRDGAPPAGGTPPDAAVIKSHSVPPLTRL